MPLVDTVIKFWRGQGVAFRAVAASDYANQSNGYFSAGSQGDGADIAVWSKLLRQRFATRERLFSTTATDILQLSRRSGVFCDEWVCEWRARCIAFDGRGLCRFRRRRRIVASQPPVRIFDAPAVRSFGEHALRQCAQHQRCDGDFHANSLKPTPCQHLTRSTAPLFLFAGTEARLPSCCLLAGRRGYCFDLLFFRLSGLSIALLLAFGHVHSLLFLR
jgi:hypothetical protein